MIALDQARDSTFQTQLAAMARFVQDVLVMSIKNECDDEDVCAALDEAYIEMKPIHMNDPLGHKGSEEGHMDPDYGQMAVGRYVRAVVKGQKTFDDMTYALDEAAVKTTMAQTRIKFESMGIECEFVQEWLIAAFVNDIEQGAWQL
jgi:hypothetical protein